MANTESYKGIYSMHKYWGKKPFNEISRFIEQYTQEGDTVLDSFCGSGVTLLESLKANRKCVGVDLNPIAIKLAKVSMTAVDLDIINSTFESIKNRLQQKINSLYEVDHNGQKTLVTHTIWKGDKPLEVWYSTSNQKKSIRVGTEIDIRMATHPAISPKWYPTTLMYENSRINVASSQTVADLFTNRALVGLSLLLDEINKIPDEKVRDVFHLTLTGTLSQASNLVFVIRRRKKGSVQSEKAEVGSWVIGYWVPEEHFEINVWRCFENRFKRIIKGESEIFSLFSSKPAHYLSENAVLINGSATQLPLSDESIDYVFIDPPHANRILYLEQSLMWNAWLHLDTEIDWNNEIVISEAIGRNKDQKNYNILLDAAFSEISRVLKHDRYFSLAFNCLDDNTWIDLLNLLIKHGFELSEIIPLEYSATSVIQDNRKNALKTDFVLTFKNKHTHNLHEITFNTNESALKEKIKALIIEHSNHELHNILTILFAESIPFGYIYKISSIIKIYHEFL